MSSCEETTLDKISRPSTTIEAAVSSHEDSIPRMRVGMFRFPSVRSFMVAQTGKSPSKRNKVATDPFRVLGETNRCPPNERTAFTKSNPRFTGHFGAAVPSRLFREEAGVFAPKLSANGFRAINENAAF